MNSVIVNTGLDHFCPLHCITHITGEYISGKIIFVNSESFIALEAMAQISAYHTRFLNDFNRHSFLLKVKKCSGPFNEILNGEYVVDSKITARTEMASTHNVTIHSSNKVLFKSEIMTAFTDYSADFPEEKFKKYYRDVFTCLMKNGLEK